MRVVGVDVVGAVVRVVVLDRELVGLAVVVDVKVAVATTEV